MREPNYGLILEAGELVVKRSPRAAFFDARFLVAALLEHVARGDGRVCEREMETMIELVADYFGLDTGRAEQHFTQALRLYAQNLDLPGVGRLLQEILEPDEREEVVYMLLEVIAADGRKGVDELEALDEVASCLDISETERHIAYQLYFERRQGLLE